jgi:RNA polymerase sigma factor, sigma-70 family
MLKNAIMDISNGRDRLKELEHVIAEFQDQIFRFAFFRTGCFPDAQDIVQDVFVKLYHDFASLHAVSNLKSYLFRSVSNACTDYHRNRKRKIFEPLDTVPAYLERSECTTSQQLLLVEEYNRIERLLDDLPNEQAEIIRLKVLDNLSFVEIATLFEIPVTTVKSRFKYGIDKLKTKIEKTKEVHHGMQ